jgi:hypothetical protein
MHGSPWRYDSYVPIIFAGANVEPQTIHRRVHPVDVAPNPDSIGGFPFMLKGQMENVG